MSMKICFLGDIMLGRFVASAYEKNLHKVVDAAIVDICKKSDFVFGNLESPLCTHLTAEGPLVFKGLPALLDQFNWVHGFSLSNNHINDCGMQGMTETVRLLEKAGFITNGLFKETYQPLELDEGGTRVAIITCTDMMNREFDEVAGWQTLRIDDPRLDAAIADCKSRGFFVILYAHVGKLFTRYPDPETRDFLQKKVNRGVDLVVSAHPHVLGCSETYQGSEMFYSLGDFVMDGRSGRRRTSGILTVDIDDRKLSDWSLDIACINPANQTVIASKKRKQRALRKFNRATQRLKDNAARYGAFYERQYKCEIVCHALSTLSYVARKQGPLKLFSMLWKRRGAVLSVFSRVTFRDHNQP